MGLPVLKRGGKIERRESVGEVKEVSGEESWNKNNTKKNASKGILSGRKSEENNNLGRLSKPTLEV